MPDRSDRSDRSNRSDLSPMNADALRQARMALEQAYALPAFRSLDSRVESLRRFFDGELVPQALVDSIEMQVLLSEPPEPRYRLLEWVQMGAVVDVSPCTVAARYRSLYGHEPFTDRKTKVYSASELRTVGIRVP